MNNDNNFNNQNNTKAMVEAALISVISVILILLIKQIPILNYFLFVVPTIFALVWVRRGRKYGVLSVVVAFLIALILGFLMESIFILVYGGSVSALMSEFIIKNKRTSVVIFAGTIGAFISLFVLLYFMQLIAGVSFNQIISESMNQTKEMFANMDTEAFKEIQIDEQIKIMEYSLRQFLPSIMFFCAFFVSAANYASMRWAFKRFLNKKIRRDYLRDFSLPNNLMFGIFFMLFGAWIFKWGGGDPSGAVVDNILSLSFFALFIQGLAVLAFIIHRKKWSRATKIALVLFCIFFMSLLQIVFVILGSLDLIFNLRKKVMNNNSDSENRR